MSRKKTKKKKNKKLRAELRSIKINTYTKALVLVIIAVSLMDLQLSYVLAFLGKTQIAESLSIQICVTIIGTALIYMIRAYFDSKAEHNNNSINKELDQLTVNKIQSILDAANVTVDVNEVLNNTTEDSSINEEDDIESDNIEDEYPTENEDLEEDEDGSVG